MNQCNCAGDCKDSSMNQQESEKFYSVSEMAERLGMSQKGIRDLIHKHNLPASRLGKAYRIKESDFLKFFEEKRTAQ